MGFFTQWTEFLFKGVLVTLWISWLGLLLGAVLGLMVALLRRSNFRILNGLAIAYVETFRSLPILVLMFFSYYGLSFFVGVNLPPFVAVTLALTLSASAMMAEVIRGGIDSVGRGQWEAARASGIPTWRIWKHIILPQAMRVILPPSVGVYIATLKDSSLAAIIGYVELTKAGLLVREATGEDVKVLAVIALLYFVINYTISLVGGALERRFHIV